MSDIEIIKTESVFLDKCKCCFGEGELKNMWEEFIWNDRKEIYGEMLSECFDISIDLGEVDNYQEQICESCICRLRNALDFKREVLACSQLRHEFLNNSYTEVKSEVQQFEEPSLEDNYEITSSMSKRDSYYDKIIKPSTGKNNYNSDLSDEENVFYEVQYLDLDDDDTTEETEDTKNILENTLQIAENTELYLNTKQLKREPQNSSMKKSQNSKQYNTKAQKRTRKQSLDYKPVSSPESSDGEDKPKRKWPQRKKRQERVYKQYTRDAMVKAMEAVQSGRLTKLEAAEKFRVPIKTLNHKLHMGETKTEKEKLRKSQAYFNFVEEVKKVLTYTNAVPFKTKAARYFCAYCSTDGPFFEEPEDLRIHTRTKHVEEKMRNIEVMLRPQGHNEVLKVDIDSFHCTICCTILPTWNSMFQHLDGTHNIQLDEAYTRIIPYILKRDLMCALCKESFTNFHTLDGHMNSHYSSYICQECGDTFLSFIRLDKHVRIHRLSGRFPCKECGKVFTLEKYMQKHYDHVHKKELNIKCVYCPEKFVGMFQRHQHMVQKHKEKVKVITCELCGLRFEWKAYYVAHLRKKHKILQKC